MASQTVLTRDPPPPLDPSRPTGAVSAATPCPPPRPQHDRRPQWSGDVRTLLMTSMTVQGLHVPALRMRTALFLWSPGGLSAARAASVAPC